MTSIAEVLWRFPSASMAWRNLGRNRVRTALAALGVVIGVVAIASLGMAGAALQYQATQDLGGLANEVTVVPGEDNDEDGLTEAQVGAIQNVVTDATVVPQKSDQTVIESGSEQSRVSVTGVTEASALYDVGSGRAPDRLQSGALIDSTTATELNLGLGDPVEYDGRLYRIRGIIDSGGGFGGPGGGTGTLVLPISALDSEFYSTVSVVAEDGEQATRIATSIEDRLNEREEVVSASTLADVQEQIESFLGTLNLALFGIGSISLVVASVAILNVMLMSTVERRGEIGVLRAVGIRRGEVLRMILTEAAFLGVIGGVLGVIVSFGVGLLMFEFLVGDATLVFVWQSSQYLILGFVFAVGASVLSGLYPAWKAANERPVDSLRG
ncbi:ABC transporter permease [Halanaeroarchaeum sulfurireducens]|uniref:ABC transporter permease n=2 Tax=Halanaeroarchaeum sulfurireducens TaxID=1604004 RepID=A0A0F7PD95_9EURY|nr:ABC transporter permease [Halanaeroarchaeum sulfurireducens]AKH97624.1 ABC transporter permease [Halanaeroarchaeum sulfurireducens]